MSNLSQNLSNFRFICGRPFAIPFHQKCRPPEKWRRPRALPPPAHPCRGPGAVLYCENVEIYKSWLTLKSGLFGMFSVIAEKKLAAPESESCPEILKRFLTW